MTRPRLNASQRTAIERGRDLHEDRMAEQRATAQLKERHQVTTKKTAQGDRVERFPKTGELLDIAATLREELTDLYDTATVMAERNARIERDGKPDSSRFDVLREG